ncbi:MAG: cyclic nucleotide-binding protein [Planctomycetaceae bacterium]|nr:cyclic nucleotide-binding protein [Planctomycetaceae bacterium]
MRRTRIAPWLVVWLLIAGFTSIAHAADEWIDLIRPTDPAKHAVQGEWTTTSDGLVTKAATGSRLILPIKPAGEYDFRVAFTRRTGVHSVGLFFVAGGKQAAFEVDAWGQHLAGIQEIKGQQITSNPTRVENQTLENGRKYSAEVRVRRDKVEVFLDDKLLTTHRTDGSDLGLPNLWRLPDQQSLGLGAWESETIFHSVAVRRVSGEVALATTTPAPRPLPAPGAKSAAPTKSTSKSDNSSPKTATKSATSSGRAPRVLLVIANQHFFYREYSEPKQELEWAGCVVEVAAGRKAPCRAHQGTGEGADGGVVQPDLAIADADASRYDAILFSGGWGSSMYQFAFQGTYQNTAYNGERSVKEAVNKLITSFIQQDKYVCALCHGTTVLAWARVNGRSPLAGKQATGPVLNGPAGNYPGYRGSSPPPSRWHAETNGARMVAPNSVGDPNTLVDDVVIDGKIMTGQDDPTAREMGRQLARALMSERSPAK